MFDYFFFSWKPVFYLFSWDTCIDAIGFGIFGYNASCCNDTSIGDVYSTHNDSPITYPNIITYVGDIIKSFPAIIFVSNTFSHTNRCTYLLVVMIISSYNTHMIGYYYIIANYTISFYN